MRAVRYIKRVNFNGFHGPVLILLFILHLNQMIIYAQRLSNKAFTFNGSIATIHNYLDQFANQNTLFEYQGYPTSNLREYNPGPFPYIYILKFSWVVHGRYDINPIYLSNLLLSIYPTVLILTAVFILYRNNLKLLSIATAAFTLIFSYIHPKFYGGNLGQDIFDWGFEYITLLSALTILMLILSYKRVSSTHIPLLVYAGLLFHSHFIALSLAPFAIIYALLLIFLSIKSRKYKFNYFLLIPTFVIIYLPIIFRFAKDPLYLYRAVKINNPASKHRQTNGFFEEIEFFFKTTPLGINRDICGQGQIDNCISLGLAKVYLILLIIFISFIIFLALRRNNLFIKILIVSSLLLINFNTFNGYDTHHSSVALGLTLAGIIYYISKFNKLVFLLVIATLLMVNFGERGVNNIKKDNFSNEWVKSMKPHKFKVDICELSEVGICNKELLISERDKETSFFEIYGGDNHAQVSIIELLKNKIDICLFNDNLGLGRLEKLRCGEKEVLDETRYEIFFISGRQNMSPNILDGYNKIGEIVDRRVDGCISSNNTSIEEKFNKSIKLSPCYGQYGFNLTNESTALYLKKDSKEINKAKLLYLSNLNIERVMLEIEQGYKSIEISKRNCINYKTKVCITGNDFLISVNQNVYQNIGELYDFS